MPVVKYIYPLLLFASALAMGQDKRYVFTHLGVSDGLLSDHVYSIMQDDKGFIWFGTAGGLQRYDGSKIVMFLKDPREHPAPSNNISQVLQAGRRFWVRSGRQVSIFNPATFRFTEVPVHTGRSLTLQAANTLQAAKGNILLLVPGFGLIPYDTVKNEFSALRKIPLPPGWTAGAFAEDPASGKYWMGGDSGLCVYDPATRELYYRRHNPRHIKALDNALLNRKTHAVGIDKSQRLWITTAAPGKPAPALYCYDLTTNTFIHGITLPDSDGQFAIQQNGTVWTTGTLQEYIPRDNRFRPVSSSCADDYGIRYGIVYCFFEDREHNIWLGTDKGVYMFNPGSQLFTEVRPGQHADKPAPVTSFVQTGSNIWVGTMGHGLFAFDSALRPLPGILPQLQADRQAFQMIGALHLHTLNHTVWAGCSGGNLLVYNPSAKTVTRLQPGAVNKEDIRCMTEDSKGKIWIGTQNGRLVSCDAAAGEAGFSLAYDFGAAISALLTDNNGHLWVCTQGSGIYETDPLHFSIIKHIMGGNGNNQSLYADAVDGIRQLNDSTMALCTGFLNILHTNTGRVRHFTFTEGLPANTIISLEKDNNGFLWLATLSGICRFNPANNATTRYGYKEGIINNNFTTGAAYRLADGRILAGTNDGFCTFQPAKINSDAVPPDVSITDFNLLSNYLVPDSILQLDKVRLTHRQNTLSIDFAALTYLQNNQIVYFYRMKGYDRDWGRADITHTAKYMNLPPGDYVFEVKCETGNGVRCKHITRLAIYIQPPFWQRWWFYVLACILVAAVIYGVYRIRINQLLGMEKVRSRIARDLHDDMGSTLSTINILSEMARMKLEQDGGKVMEYLDKISDNSSRMMESMDDIVWSINPMNDSMQRITARMREFSTSVLEAKNIEEQFRVDEAVNELTLDMEARRDFFLIFKEAINNIAKYAQCTHVSIEVLARHSMLLMTITDNGTGFDTATADSGNGLQNMRKRAQSLHGSLTIASKKNEGTTVTLQIPVK